MEEISPFNIQDETLVSHQQNKIEVSKYIEFNSKLENQRYEKGDQLYFFFELTSSYADKELRRVIITETLQTPPPLFYLVKPKLPALPPLPPKSKQKLHSERSFSCDGTPN